MIVAFPLGAMALHALEILAALAFAAATVHAQQGPPGCKTPQHREFDFWVGEWTVTDSARTRTLGSSVITLGDGGCSIHERWTGAGAVPSTGQSLNAYDLATGQWGQDWVGSGGDVAHLRGAFRDGSMVLEGDAKDPAGRPLRNRITWTLKPDGRVRQLWEASADGGRTWSVSFDGWYAKRS